jgi:hypothetical protein
LPRHCEPQQEILPFILFFWIASSLWLLAMTIGEALDFLKCPVFANRSEAIQSFILFSGLLRRYSSSQ